MNVEFIQWPAEASRRESLAALQRPRLLLVTQDEEPPITADHLEDWIRVPAPERDIRARVASLVTAAGHRRRPTLDENGLLRAGTNWVSLPPIEARLMERLMDDWSAVVSRSELAAAGWPAQAPGRNALDVHILRLRRRVDSVGVVIRTIRSRGYLVETLGSS